jgi:GNAT superfamily N-acetyltransferase
VLGFLAGCADTRRCYLSMLRRAALPLSWLAGRSLLTVSVLRKLPAVAWHPFRAGRRGASEETPGETGAELLAIAVHAGSRGQNIGRLLVQEFEQGLLAWGVRGSYTVSTNVEEVVSNGFYERVGFLPAAQVRHHALTLQVYRKQVTGDVGTSPSGNGNGADDL